MKAEREQVNFGAGIVLTDRFRRNWGCLSVQARRIVTTKVTLLAENQCHPSLQVHRVRRSGGNIWECYVSATLRLLFSTSTEKDSSGCVMWEAMPLSGVSISETFLSHKSVDDWHATLWDFVPH